MAAPIEIRNFHRKFTLQDAVDGIMPIRDPQRPAELYVPAVTQYRYKQRVTTGGNVEMIWSDWQNLPFVKEGSPEDVA